MLNVESVNVFYDEFHAVQDASLRVERGEIVALVGPNGHGKTTLLKAICGLLPVRSGRIFLEGEPTERLRAPDLVARGVVYVAEDRHLFPDMTVMENLSLGAYQKRGREAFSRNLELVFELYPRLAERRKQPARTLSGGEAQMLALGRGLMSAGRIMAIDEPSLGLAPNLVHDMLETIRRLNAEGITILLVEQNVGELERLADRAYRMEEGRVVGEVGLPSGSAEIISSGRTDGAER